MVLVPPVVETAVLVVAHKISMVVELEPQDKASTEQIQQMRQMLAVEVVVLVLLVSQSHTVRVAQVVRDKYQVLLAQELCTPLVVAEALVSRGLQALV